MKTFDVTAEQPISLAQAADFLPRRENGKKHSIRTIERWIRHGHKGVELEGAYIGKTLYTSIPSLRRFSAALSGGQPVTHSPSPAAVAYLIAEGFELPSYEAEQRRKG